MSKYAKHTTQELKAEVYTAIRSNDRVAVAELTAELKNRLRMAGITPPEKLTTDPVLLKKLITRRDAIMQG